jgi:capsular polysaccharide biosynthesis protein
MVEPRAFGDAIYDPATRVSLDEVERAGIGRPHGTLWPEQVERIVPPFYANQLAFQFSWWAHGFYRSLATGPQPVPAVRMHCLTGASVLGRGCVVRLPDGRLLDLLLSFLSITPPSTIVRRDGQTFWIRRERPREAVGGTFVLGHIGGDNNYAHWITCTLPIWQHFAARLRGTGVRLIVGNLAGFQRSALAALGIGADDIFEMPDAEVAFDEVIVTTPIDLWRTSAFVAATCAAVGERVAPAADRGPPRRLFISRRDSPQRRLLNEASVETLLGNFGFETIVNAELDFVEQVSLFRAAEIVVGGHGAGLANTVFCVPGTHVIELFPEYCVQPHFRSLASICGLSHGYVVGTTLELEGSRTAEKSWGRSYVVGVPQVRDAVRTAITRLARGAGQDADGDAGGGALR